MSMTMVSRRIAGYTKSTQKRHAAPPRREAAGEMVGERAKPYAALAAPRPQAPRSWWQKARKPAAMFLGVLAACGFAFILYQASPKSPGGDGTEFAATAGAAASGSGTSMRRGGRAGSYPGSEGATAPTLLSDRPGLTDESFLATAYVRRKVSLPYISGECVVTASGSRDVGACLRQQQAR